MRRLTKEELLKFDVIIFGDVDPEFLGASAVGHLRVTRSDAPKAWFWWANYVLTWDLLCGLFTRRKAI